MTLISQSLGSLIGGVSQQSPMIRPVSQVETQVNAYSDPVEGLRSRPATEHIAQLLSGPGARPLVHWVNKGPGHQYVVIIVDGDIKAFDLEDGTPIIVSFPDGSSYLSAPFPREQLKCVSTEDFTLVLNTAVEVGVGTGPASTSEQLVKTITFTVPAKETLRPVPPDDTVTDTPTTTPIYPPYTGGGYAGPQDPADPTDPTDPTDLPEWDPDDPYGADVPDGTSGTSGDTPDGTSVVDKSTVEPHLLEFTGAADSADFPFMTPLFSSQQRFKSTPYSMSSALTFLKNNLDPSASNPLTQQGLFEPAALLAFHRLNIEQDRGWAAGTSSIESVILQYAATGQLCVQYRIFGGSGEVEPALPLSPYALQQSYRKADNTSIVISDSTPAMFVENALIDGVGASVSPPAWCTGALALSPISWEAGNQEGALVGTGVFKYWQHTHGAGGTSVLTPFDTAAEAGFFGASLLCWQAYGNWYTQDALNNPNVWGGVWPSMTAAEKVAGTQQYINAGRPRYDGSGVYKMGWPSSFYNGGYPFSYISYDQGAVKTHYYYHTSPITATATTGDWAMYITYEEQLAAAVDGYPGINITHGSSTDFIPYSGESLSKPVFFYALMYNTDGTPRIA